ncbi:hypothetical protein [Arthrobacter sp. RCC_34]|uniref:hypothetical protein n=1 Tax=Arthrobacter sp. RCC_34 TaxID=3239230 RepID=UPI0035268AC8
MDFPAVLAHVQEQLADAGITSATDSRNLELPGAWVTPGPIHLDRLDRETGQVEVDLFLIAPDTGAGEALVNLADLLRRAAEVLVFEDAAPVNVQLPNHGADPMPGLQISLSYEVTPD